jgi:hypothetical protein
MMSLADSVSAKASLPRFAAFARGFTRTVHAAPVWLICGGLFLAGTLLAAAYGSLRGFTDPNGVLVADAHACLQQAHTFAAGRLTNPSPRHPEFFEVPHTLVVPTYQAKYPPAQGLIMALGLRLFGHPIYGSWLGSGLFAAALFWALRSRLSNNWALVGSLQAVSVVGVNHLWVQSYWGGGMLGAIGGALLLGALLRLPRNVGMPTGLGLGVGLALLANSRPFEGLLCTIGCALAFSGRLRAAARHPRVGSWLIGLALPLILAGSFMARYNSAVTGSPWTLPYALHQRQYGTGGPFTWSTEYVEPLRNSPTGRLAYMPELLRGQAVNASAAQIGGAMLRHGILTPHCVFTMLGFPYSALLRMEPVRWFLRLPGYLLFAGMLLAAVRLRSTRALLVILLFQLVACCAEGWVFLHYYAPFYACGLMLCTRLQRLAWKCVSFGIPALRREIAVGLATLFPVMLIAAAFWPTQPVTPGGASASHPSSDPPTAAAPDAKIIEGRSVVIQYLNSLDVKSLVLISHEGTAHGYAEGYFEWNYNYVIDDAAKVLLAHDLGEPLNRKLIAEYPDRKIWRLVVLKRSQPGLRDGPARLSPYRP